MTSFLSIAGDMARTYSPRMEISQYIVDAFTTKIFCGNPAAVCFLPRWLPDKILASIAKENNLSETAFIVRLSTTYEIRWFTPSIEVDLCGHATLASAFIVFNFMEPELSSLKFSSKSGWLEVTRSAELISLNFPSRPGKKVDCPSILPAAMNIKPSEVYLSRDYLLIVDSEEDVLGCMPDYSLLQNLPSFGIIVSAPGKQVDFVSRVFFPTDSILEDPVTGSAHCTLIPYWSKRLEKKILQAAQLSERGGELLCTDCGDRVIIAGRAVLFGKGSIFVPD
jgi:PhzF family phenazine biosynthesis protein